MGILVRKQKREDQGIPATRPIPSGDYRQLVTGISGLLDEARHTVVRSTNSVVVSAYWEIGRRIVEFEQGGRERAEYGEDLVPSLARDLTRVYGRGFSARALYEAEAVRAGWSVRQLDRQISTQFFERVTASADPERMFAAARKPSPVDPAELQHHLRDPYLLEFLDLKDEYSESDLEDAIVRHLESFLLELGAGFTFVARQKRIRIGDEWYRIDLLLYHRALRCLVVVDLKLGRFSHADAGQMNLYLNYAREHLMGPDEHEPVGLILCSAKNDAVVHYAAGGGVDGAPHLRCTSRISADG